MNKQYLYVWNSQQGINDLLFVHTVIKDMNKDKSDYSPESNVQSLARLFMYSLPGNTLDLLLDKIASELRNTYSVYPEFLHDNYDIQNRIRGILQDLCHIEE